MRNVHLAEKSHECQAFFPLKNKTKQFRAKYSQGQHISNSKDSDKTPGSAASDLGLNCWPMSLLWDARLKCVKMHTSNFQVFFFYFFCSKFCTLSLLKEMPTKIPDILGVFFGICEMYSLG